MENLIHDCVECQLTQQGMVNFCPQCGGPLTTRVFEARALQEEDPEIEEGRTPQDMATQMQVLTGPINERHLVSFTNDWKARNAPMKRDVPPVKDAPAAAADKTD